VVVLPPSISLYEFKGAFKYKQMQIEYESFIPRGSRLKSEGSIVVMAVYVGMDTKQMLNHAKTSLKSSKLEGKTMWTVLLLILVMLLLSSIATVFARVVFKDRKPAAELFFSWLLILARLVPASLIVSLEFIKLFQGLLVSYDKWLYSELTSYQAKVNNSSVIENMGQIQLVLSDKTGTITCNIMCVKDAHSFD
jgi:P-type E1-E2 ATPase